MVSQLRAVTVATAAATTTPIASTRRLSQGLLCHLAGHEDGIPQGDPHSVPRYG